MSSDSKTSQQLVSEIHQRSVYHDLLKEELLQVKEQLAQGAMAILHLTITNVSGLEETTETNPSFVLVSKNADFLLKEKDRREFHVDTEISVILLNTQGTMDIHVAYQKKAPEQIVEETSEKVEETTEKTEETTEKAEEVTEQTEENIETVQVDEELESKIEVVPNLSLYHVSINLSDFVETPGNDKAELTVEATNQEGENITLTISYEQDSISNYISNLANELKSVAAQLQEDAVELNMKVLQERAHATSSNYTKAEEEQQLLQEEQEKLIKESEKNNNEDEYEDVDEVAKKPTKKTKGKGKGKGGKIIKKRSKKASTFTLPTASLSEGVTVIKNTLLNNKEAIIFLATSTLAYFYGEVFSV